MINETSITFQTFLDDLVNWAKAQDDSATWEDFYISSIGETFFEALAGYATYMNARIDNAKIESALLKARLKTSIYLHAGGHDYPVSRKFAPRFRLEWTPSGTEAVLKTEPIGTLNGNFISMKNSHQFSHVYVPAVFKVEAVDPVKLNTGIDADWFTIPILQTVNPNTWIEYDFWFDKGSDQVPLACPNTTTHPAVRIDISNASDAEEVATAIVRAFAGTVFNEVSLSPTGNETGWQDWTVLIPSAGEGVFSDMTSGGLAIWDEANQLWSFQELAVPGIMVSYTQNYVNITQILGGYLEGLSSTVANDDFLVTEITEGANPIHSVDVFIGQWQSESFTASAEWKWKVYSIINKDHQIDNEEVYVSINGKQVKVVRALEDWTEGTVYIRTNYLGGIDLVFGDWNPTQPNKGAVGYRLRRNDVVEISWLETPGYIPATDIYELQTSTGKRIFKGNISVAGGPAGDVIIPTVWDATSYTMISGFYTDGSNEEDIQKVKALAPRYWSSMRRCVRLQDYITHFNQVSFIISASGLAHHIHETVPCCEVQLCYLKEDLTDLSDWERSYSLAHLYSLSMVGTRIVINDPQAVWIEPQLEVVVESGADIGVISTEIEAAFNEYANTLQESFYLTTLIAKLSGLSGVKRVYLTRPVSDRELAYTQYFRIRKPDIFFTTDSSYTSDTLPSVIDSLNTTQKKLDYGYSVEA